MGLTPVRITSGIVGNGTRVAGKDFPSESPKKPTHAHEHITDLLLPSSPHPAPPTANTNVSSGTTTTPKPKPGRTTAKAGSTGLGRRRTPRNGLTKLGWLEVGFLITRASIWITSVRKSDDDDDEETRRRGDGDRGRWSDDFLPKDHRTSTTTLPRILPLSFYLKSTCKRRIRLDTNVQPKRKRNELTRQRNLDQYPLVELLNPKPKPPFTSCPRSCLVVPSRRVPPVHSGDPRPNWFESIVPCSV